MSLLSREELARLAARSTGPCVSMFLPTYKAGPEVRQNSIRFKNLLREAESGLQARGVERETIDALLEPARRLLADDVFWRYQGEGLAVFAAPDEFHSFRLPLSVEQAVTVNDRFTLTPLLPLLGGDGRFFVLAISLKGGVRLLEGWRFSAREIDLGRDAPGSVEEFFSERGRPDDMLQFRQRQIGGQQERAALYHGHGEGEDALDEEIVQYFKRIDRVVMNLMPTDREPLVIAAVDWLIARYRSVTAYRAVLGDGVEGNPDELSIEQLHERAWPLVEPLFATAQRAAVDRYRDLMAGDLATDAVEPVIVAAHDGRIDTLFVAQGERVAGRFDEQSREVDLGEGEDLLDLAAFRTLVTGGRVFAVDRGAMPVDAPLAAIFRY